MTSPSERSGQTRREFLTRLGAGVAVGGLATRERAASARRAPAVLRSVGLSKPLGQPSGEVRFWTQNYASPEVQKKVLDDLVAKYKAESGVEVRYEIINWSDASNRWNLAMQVGDVPDVADTFWLSSRIVAGRGEWGPINLDEYVAEGVFGDVNRFYQLAVEESKYQGSWYAMPWRFDTRITNYRTDYFAEAGVEAPATTDQVVDVAKALTKPDDSRYGVALSSVGGAATSYHQVWMWLLHIWDVPMLTPDYKRAAFNTPAAAEAFQWAADLTVKHKVTPPNILTPGFDTQTEFMAGRLAMTFPMPAGFPVEQMETAPQLEGKYAGALLPKARAQASPGWSAPVVVFGNSQNREAAVDWLRYYTTTEAQIALCTAYSRASSSREVMADPFYRSSQWWQTIGEQAETARLTDMPTPAWSELSAFPGGPIYNMMNEVLAGRPVDELLPKYEAQFNEILVRYE